MRGVFLNPRFIEINFKEYINDQIFVDQSMLLDLTNSLLTRQSSKYICFTKPRRFGKTLLANMIAAYYMKIEKPLPLFDKLAIAQTANYHKYHNAYDVIFINMLDYFDKTTQNAEQQIKLLSGKIIQELKAQYSTLDLDSYTDLYECLQAIYTETQNYFIFVIDEWDAIFREQPNNTSAHESYINFLRRLLKDRTYIKLAYMTGILPIGWHELGWFKEYSMLVPQTFADFIGFSSETTKELCQAYHTDFSKMVAWYDGYSFAGKYIFNPYAVIQAIDRCTCSRQFRNYWCRSGSIEAITDCIELNLEGFKEDLIKLIDGKQILVNTLGFKNNLNNSMLHCKDDALTRLVHLGYLGARLEEGDEAYVYIPNQEIKLEFIRALQITDGKN